MARPANTLELRAREMAIIAGVDPDSRATKTGSDRGMPAWCSYTQQARNEQNVQESSEIKILSAGMLDQGDQYKNSPITVIGDHDEGTISQMRNCMSVGNSVAGVLCADGHLGYAQPVGGVIAYENQISISGVGFDIGCGNLAVRLDTKYSDISSRVSEILSDIRRVISFGVGRTNNERVDHELFENKELWHSSGMEDYRPKAISQLGTVGSGNHYVDLLKDESDNVWIGVHFGSRGLGHTTATRYLKMAGGKDGIHALPTVVDESSELGQNYISAMTLAGQYAYAGREWVVERVRQLIGGEIMDSIHNHHNFAWSETHNGRNLWVVRKGATPAFPGQRGFVGGSMGDNAVILEGVDSEQAKSSLYSTVHGAGRLFGRMAAKRAFTRTQMDEWLQKQGVMLAGGDIDESPMAYRRLPDVLAHHKDSVKVLHSLKPFAVAMAGDGEFDPFKD